VEEYLMTDKRPPPIVRTRPTVERDGIRLLVPPGWDVRARRAEEEEDDGRTLPVVHASTIPLQAGRGDYGSGVVEGLGAEDVFVTLVEFGEEAVGSALFAAVDEIPDVLADDFHPSQLQRSMPGQAGVQKFFTLGTRAFCLYVVVGAYSRRALLTPKIATLLSGLEIDRAGN
jgi:hypothetical protein